MSELRFAGPPPAEKGGARLPGSGRPGVPRPNVRQAPTKRQPNRGVKDTDPEFTCTHCDQVKPMSEANFVGLGEKRRRTGWCHDCAKIKNKERNDKQLAKVRGSEYTLPEIRDHTNPIIDGHRTCWICEEVKPIDSFYKDSTVASGYAVACVLCFAIRKRSAHILRTYKITQEEYDEMLVAQNGVCAICKQPETARRVSYRESVLAVDHDHSCCSGKKSCGSCNRGLLCVRCNTMLGYAGDNIEILQAAVAYLTLHAGVEVAHA